MKKYDAVMEILENMSTCELLDYWNQYVWECAPDDAIMSMDSLDEYLNGMQPWDILRASHFGDFNPCDDYFKFNAYGNLVSFNDYNVEDSIYIDDLADYIVRNDEDFSSDEIREALDSCDERGIAV